MPTNDFLPFGNAVGANVMTQADYLALAARSTGFVAGTAKSAQLNKAWRQSSIIASMLAQFIADQSGQNAIDDGTTSTLQANLLTAIRVAGRQATILTDTGVANAYTATNTPALAALPSTGYGQRVNIANANTGAATYAPDGLAAKPVYGLGLQPLQGGELPAGVVVLMYLVQAGVNGGNGAWIIIDSLGGAQQIAPATKSQHAAQLGQISGVVGQARNVRMAITAASASATMTADEIIVETALGGLRYCLPSFNKTVNLATTGAGGMDTGTAPVSGYVSVYAIYNPTTGVSALLACAQATSNGSIYSGANMPAGYTASALVSSNATNASSQFKVSTTLDRTVIIPNSSGYTSSGGTIPSPTPISLSSTVPLNAKFFSGILSASSTVATAVGISVSADAANSGYQNANCSSVQQVTAPYRCPIFTAQTAYITATAGGGTPTYSINVSSYEF